MIPIFHAQRLLFVVSMLLLIGCKQKSEFEVYQDFSDKIANKHPFIYDLRIDQKNNRIYYAVWDADSDKDLIFCRFIDDFSIDTAFTKFFTGQYVDIEPKITKDGKKLLFSSNRPTHTYDSIFDLNLWEIEKSDNRWNSPVCFDQTINSEVNESVPFMTSTGNIYWARHLKPHKLMMSIQNKEGYQTPLFLNDSINKYFSSAPFVSWDNKYLLYHSNRPENIGRSDIYICKREGNYNWSTPLNISSLVNSIYSEGSPWLSFDNEYLFFNRIKNDSCQIHCVSFEEVISSLKQN